MNRSPDQAPAPDAETLRIVAGDFSNPHVIDLLRFHLTDALAVSPPGTSYALDLAGLQVPAISVFAAWRGERLAGIGALKELDAATGELKSMRTHPEHFRRGVAAALLDHLIALARARGYRKLSLETGAGPAFAPAIALYERTGFRFGERFGDYIPGPFNQFMHLSL